MIGLLSGDTVWKCGIEKRRWYEIWYERMGGWMQVLIGIVRSRMRNIKEVVHAHDWFVSSEITRSTEYWAIVGRAPPVVCLTAFAELMLTILVVSSVVADCMFKWENKRMDCWNSLHDCRLRHTWYPSNLWMSPGIKKYVWYACVYKHKTVVQNIIFQC